MEFKDFLVYLKTIPLPVAYQEAIDSLKPYGSVIISFERTLGQPGDSLVLSDPEALALVYQFVYWALRRYAHGLGNAICSFERILRHYLD